MPKRFTSREARVSRRAEAHNNTAQVNGSANTAIHQANSNVAVNFFLWW
ncbi:hypothetical protein AB0F18_00565 [Streptomyces sp. NPDC029216]